MRNRRRLHSQQECRQPHSLRRLGALITAKAGLHSARHRNQALGLTGCLHFEDGMFFQWLEGPRAGLVQAVDLILADDRHQEITVLDQGALDQRRFQDWRMRFSDRDRASLMDWFASSDKSTVRPKDYAGAVVAFLVSIAI